MIIKKSGRMTEKRFQIDDDGDRANDVYHGKQYNECTKNFLKVDR